MEHLDERVIGMISRGEKEMEKQKDWDERLAEITAEIPLLKLTQKGLEMEMTEYLLFDKKFTIYIPSDFVKMESKHIKQKYPHESRPHLIYRNKKDTINIGFTIINESVDEEDLPGLRDVMKNAFLSVNPASTILDQGDFKQGDNSIVYYTFPSFAIGGQMYNLLFVTIMGGRVLVCNLNCLKKDMETYKLLFYGIMKTVKSDKE